MLLEVNTMTASYKPWGRRRSASEKQKFAQQPRSNKFKVTISIHHIVGEYETTADSEKKATGNAVHRFVKQYGKRWMGKKTFNQIRREVLDDANIKIERQ